MNTHKLFFHAIPQHGLVHVDYVLRGQILSHSHQVLHEVLDLFWVDSGLRHGNLLWPLQLELRVADEEFPEPEVAWVVIRVIQADFVGKGFLVPIVDPFLPPLLDVLLGNLLNKGWSDRAATSDDHLELPSKDSFFRG